ncbi:hypothetical protein V8E54_012484 [Elaphomyces granulatus]
MWDNYFLAVNPNNGSYAIHSFREKAWPYHDRVLHPACRQQDSPLHVIDPLLLRGATVLKWVEIVIDHPVVEEAARIGWGIVNEG